MLTENINLYIQQPVQIDMSSYPNILTPPSSSEDSPQSTLYNSPPSCYGIQDSAYILPQTSLAFDFDGATQATAPYLRIVEQPIDRFRFRYKSEMTGTHGSLCGQTSDRSRKQTYPTIELCNFNKRALVRCSIYQHNTKEDHRPHAHRLIKKQGKGEVDDPHDAYVTPEEGYTYVFHSMGIIHTAKKNLVPELIRKKGQLKKEEIARLEGKVRDLTQKEEIEIKGLAESESKSINLNVVCLRFDAFYETNGILLPICPPVYSHSINNLKSALTGELKIVRMDHCTSPAKGGREIFILVERVTKKNIKVKFYELDDEDNIVWEDYGKFSDLDVHHQYAIVFKTPPYKDLTIKSPVKVFIELERPSDRARSEAKEFTYTVSSNIYKPGSKRARPSYDSSSYDTSLASDELPVPINNLCLENSPTGLLDDVQLEVTSAELQQAMRNINSDEFQRIFNDFGQDYSLATDAPNEFKKSVIKSRVVTSTKTRSAKSRPYCQRSDSIEETAMAKQAVLELQNFIKTHPSDEKAVNMLCHYLKEDNKTNALHVSIRQNELMDVMFLLKMIYVWKQHELLNVRSDLYETPLHIATYLNSEEIVANLIVCKASVCVGDSEMNTPLHVAVISNASIAIFEKLFSSEDKTFVDMENNEGNTALNIAIENGNLKALKLLCLNGADINKQHKKNGYTPLRFAIEKQNVDIVKYILQHKDLQALVEDFQDINPLQAAINKDNSELVDVITQYMKQNNYVNVEIKNEVEDYSDDDFEEKFSIKLEQISSEELREMYTNVKNFTPACLDDISQILDQSGTWQNLADLLDLGHLMRSGLCDSKNSPTKLLLKLAIETNGDSVLQIRDFLENLDETQAVEIIDNMVRTQFM
ncbi:nuclear factor NF-kappa-B p105 subunit isoform X2 [Zophobas morio]|uniref:nuclear factor NF-kappa-B p105 subunit isoform X2 n=1 Tax=Zophobas morio TaxID=2755281 RepID=UPI003083ED2F